MAFQLVNTSFPENTAIQISSNNAQKVNKIFMSVGYIFVNYYYPYRQRSRLRKEYKS